MEGNIANLVLKELREFREESNRKWKENDKRFANMEDRMTSMEGRMTNIESKMTNMEDRMTSMEGRMTNIEGKMTSMEDRMTNIEDRTTQLENGRIEDRRDILDVLDTMQKSITERFDELNRTLDVKFEKIFATQKVSDMEQKTMKEKIDGHEKRLNFYNARIEYLEKWKDEIENGGLYMV